MITQNFICQWIGFFCKIKSGELVLKEHEAAKWLDGGDAG